MIEKEEGLKKLLLASWSDRFLAWLIDFIIIGVVLLVITVSTVGVGSGVFLLQSLVFFVYWTYTESTRGRSLGKSVLKLMVVTKSGEPIDLTKAAIQSFGKAFIMPIDVILGYLLFQEHRQRLFSKLADTVVIKLHVEESSTDVKYVKD